MSSVAVVIDTTSYVPREILREAGIHEVSLYVNDGDSHERESAMADFDAFYARLRDADALPTTSQPSIGDFLEVYEPLAAAGQDIVSIHLSGDLSGTLESARQSSVELLRTHPDTRIEIVDSRQTCAGLGMIGMAGAAAARAGADFDGVVERVTEACAVAKVWFAVDTLEYLRRGGRIGPAQAWVGGALKIKPILSIDGEVTPIERVRTQGRAFERMAAYLEARKEDGADGWIVQHIRAPEQAERMADRGREIFGTEPLFVSEVGPVLGAHIGPGMLGVGGIPLALLR